MKRFDNRTVIVTGGARGMGASQKVYLLAELEVFSSPAAHKFHLEQDHTKRMFATLECKLAGAPIMTNLNAL